MNKKLMVGAIFGSLGLVILALITYAVLAATDLLNQQNRKISISLIAFLVISFILFIVSVTVVHLVTIYKNWNSIQDNQSTVSAGKAIGFLFIPFFNYYWIFKVWGGFPKAYNEFIDRNNLSTPKIGSIKTFVLVPLWIIVSPLVSLLFLVISKFLMSSVVYYTETNNSPILMSLLIFLPWFFMIFPYLMQPFIIAAATAESCDAVNNINLAKQLHSTKNLQIQAAFIPLNKRFLHPILIIGISSIFLLFIILGSGLLLFTSFNRSTSENNKKININRNSNISINLANHSQPYTDPKPERKADLQMSAEDFYKEALDYKKPKSEVAKYNGKVIELSGRVYNFRDFDGLNIFLRSSGNSSPVGLELGTGEAEKLKEISNNERLKAKCDIIDDYSIKLKNCLILERKAPVLPNEPADFTLTAKQYYDEIENTNLSYEKRKKNQEKYFGKVLEISGVVTEISGKKNFFTLGNLIFFTCRTNEKFMSQFDQLKDGQQATFKATHDGISLTDCIVKP